MTTQGNTTAARPAAPAPRPAPASSPRVDMDAVRVANQQFLARHPERRGTKLNLRDPRDQAAANEWRSYYAAAVRAKAPPPDPRPTRAVTQPCPWSVPQCQLKKATVSCGHDGKDRNYKLQLPEPVAVKRELEVVAGPKNNPDKVRVVTVLEKPLCTTKQHRTRHIKVTAPDGGVTYHPGTRASFDVFSPVQIPEAESIARRIEVLWKYIWPRKIVAATYVVEPQACGGTANTTTTIKVYPDIEWSVEGTFILKQEGKAGAVRLREDPNIRNRTFNQEDAAGIQLKFKASYKIDGGPSKDVGLELERSFGNHSDFIRTVDQSSKWLKKIAYTAGNFKINFPLLQLELKYASKLAEDNDGPKVVDDSELSFTANPLIGGSIEVDFLELLIKGAGYGAAAGFGFVWGPRVADLIIKIKRALAEGLSDDPDARFNLRAEVALILGVTGGIIGKGSYKRRAGKTIEVGGEIGGKLEFTFKGTAMAEGKFLVVRVVAAVEISGTAGFIGALQFGEDQKGPFYGGLLYFSGAKIEFNRWVGGKVEWRAPQGGSNPRQGKQDSVDPKKGWTVEWPAWPNDGKATRHYLL